jgi:hypothetical protein
MSLSTYIHISGWHSAQTSLNFIYTDPAY